MENETLTAGEPTVSVVVIIFKTEDYLPRCLDSFLRGSYEDFELICVNDASPDRCGELLADYAARDRRVRVITHDKNLGAAEARNSGLRAARGKYITFVDNDDEVAPNFLSYLVPLAEKTGADITAGSIQFVPDTTTPYKGAVPPLSEVTTHSFITGEKESEKDTLRYADTMILARLYLRSAIGELRFDPSLRWGEDSAFQVTLFATHPSLRVTVSDLPLYYYTKRATSFTATRPSDVVVYTSEYYLRRFEQAPAVWGRWLFLREAMKGILHYRYCHTFDLPEEKRAMAARAKKLFRECRARRKGLGRAPAWYPIFSAMARCPALYRFYRLSHDRTMLLVERRLRAARREKKRRQRENPPPPPA